MIEGGATLAETPTAIATRRPAHAMALTLAAKLGGVHALVDATCAAALYLEIARDRFAYDTLCRWVLLYNALAFGLQWLIGLLADSLGIYREISALGVWLLLVALAVAPAHALAAVVLLGVGNACYHVGAGAVVLRQAEGRADTSGIFVAPGAIGLVFGVWLGGQNLPWRWPVMLTLAVAGLLVLHWLPRRPARLRPIASVGHWWGMLSLVILLLFASVVIRSTVGGLLAGHWHTPLFALFTIAAAAMLGKMLGGLVADRYGWRAVCTLALLLSAPILLLGWHYFPLALLGMFLFQLTMPVTLVAVSLPLRAWPGLAFGLPSLALLLGALPGALELSTPWHLSAWIVPMVGLALVLVYAGLGLIPRMWSDHITPRM